MIVNSYIAIIIVNLCFYELDGSKGSLKPPLVAHSKAAVDGSPGRAPDEVEAGSPETDQ